MRVWDIMSVSYREFGLVESEHRVSPLLHHPDPLTLAMAFVKPVTCFPEQLVLFSAR